MTAAGALLVAIVIALVPVSVARPWIGFLAYAWLSFMLPHRLIGGSVSDCPFAKVIALATLVGLLFTRDRFPLPRRRELGILAALWLVTVGSTVFAAQQPQRAWAELVQFSKVLLMTCVALVLFQDRRKLRWWIAVLALSIGLVAIGGGIYSVATGFSAPLYGPAGSVIGDNNALGFALTMVLPLLAFVRSDTDQPWLRWLCVVGLFGTLIAIAATRSRGALIGLGIVAPLVLWMRPRRALVATACAVLLTVAALAPPELWQRIATITPSAYRDDLSGAQRMRSWYVAWRLGVDHPYLGAGFRPFRASVYEHYIPGYSDYHDAHNHFLQVLAEHGFTGLLLFAALLASVMWRLWRTSVAPSAGDPQRASMRRLAQATLVSLIAYVIGGMFLNLPYFELLYQLVAVALLIDVMSGAPAADRATPAARSLAAGLADSLRGR